MTEKGKQEDGQKKIEKIPDGSSRSLCDSCGFFVDRWLGYEMILKFCEMHMKNNPGHTAKPHEK